MNPDIELITAGKKSIIARREDLRKTYILLNNQLLLAEMGDLDVQISSSEVMHLNGFKSNAVMTFTDGSVFEYSFSDVRDKRGIGLVLQPPPVPGMSAGDRPPVVPSIFLHAIPIHPGKPDPEANICYIDLLMLSDTDTPIRTLFNMDSFTNNRVAIAALMLHLSKHENATHRQLLRNCIRFCLPELDKKIYDNPHIWDNLSTLLCLAMELDNHIETPTDGIVRMFAFPRNAPTTSTEITREEFRAMLRVEYLTGNCSY